MDTHNVAICPTRKTVTMIISAGASSGTQQLFSARARTIQVRTIVDQCRSDNKNFIWIDMLFWGTSCDNRIECHEAYDEKNCSTKLRSIYVVAFLVLFVLLYVLGKDKIWLRWIILKERLFLSVRLQKVLSNNFILNLKSK